jgi:hypothetical protein
MLNNRLLPPINSQQAKILLEALQHYQSENASLIHGWTLTENTEFDVNLFTNILSVWGEVEELRQNIIETFPENPAF